MNDDFDGYRKWLGIASKRRPPTHYELLAISLDEDDPDVIRAAAEQRRQYVESKRGSGHDAVVTEILYRIDEAETTLLNDELRREYDRQLKLWDKRRRSRRVDPNPPVSRFESVSGRVVGEDSGIIRTAAGVVGIFCLAFGAMAWLSFQLPWDKKPQQQIVVVQVPQAPDPEPPRAAPEPAQPPVPVVAAPVVDPPKPSTLDLLEGRLLDSWQSANSGDDVSNWSLNSGILKSVIAGPSLRTRRRFRDFSLQLEFKLPPKCNSGVFLRGRYEVQLIDSEFRKANGQPLDGVQKCGAIYGQTAPLRDVYRGPETWNSLDVRLIGETVTVQMNDTLIINAFKLRGPTEAAFDREETEPGPIFLQSQTVSGQEFRNLRITPIEGSDSVQTNVRTTEAKPAGQPIEGVFTIRWTEPTGKTDTIIYEFRPDASVYEAGRRKGVLRSDSGRLVIDFDDDKWGEVSLSRVTKDSFAGVHTWKGGWSSTWDARRVGAGDSKAEMAAAGDNRSGSNAVKVLETRHGDWDGSKTDYARINGERFELGMGNGSDFGIAGVGWRVTNVDEIACEAEFVGKPGQHDANTFVGLVLDYRVNGRFTKRVALTPMASPPKRELVCPQWGANKLPDVTERIPTEQYRGDSGKGLFSGKIRNWAPPGWDNEVWVSVLLQNTGRNTSASGTMRFNGMTPDEASASENSSDHARLSSDRAVAEWVLTKGGKVWVSVQGAESVEIQRQDRLPSGDFALTTVDLVNINEITDQDLRRLSDLKNLLVLNVMGTSVTDAGLKELAALTTLQSLNVAVTTINGSGFQHLSKLGKLEVLLCGGAPISDASLVHLKKLPGLKLLGLIDTRVTDAGMPTLGGLSTLVEIRLNFTKLTDKGLNSLKGLKNLEKLSVERTKVTKQGISTFKSALPRCEVKAD